MGSAGGSWGGNGHQNFPWEHRGGCLGWGGGKGRGQTKPRPQRLAPPPFKHNLDESPAHSEITPPTFPIAPPLSKAPPTGRTVFP